MHAAYKFIDRLNILHNMILANMSTINTYQTLNIFKEQKILNVENQETSENWGLPLFTTSWGTQGIRQPALGLKL